MRKLTLTAGLKKQGAVEGGDVWAVYYAAAPGEKGTHKEKSEAA